MTEIVATPRRRFQFRLRTLLIGVTLFAVPCAYVAHEAKIVRERKAWYVSHPAPPVPEIISRSVDQGMFGGPIVSYGDESQNPSFVRQVLGDGPAGTVVVSPNASVEEKKRVRLLFPEAVIEEARSSSE